MTDSATLAITVDGTSLRPLFDKFEVISAAFAEKAAHCRAIGADLAAVAEQALHFQAQLAALCAAQPPLIPVPTRRTP